jgi:hypothetical protein
MKPTYTPGRPPPNRTQDTGRSPLATMPPEELLAFAQQKLRMLEASRIRVKGGHRDLLDRMIRSLHEMETLAREMMAMA